MTSFVDWITPRKDDTSRKLKRGEVKGLLVAEAARVCPDFAFLIYKNTFYSFQRVRRLPKHDVIELIHIGFSLRGGVMKCCIASTLNPALVHRHRYGSGLVNGYWDLAHLKSRSPAVPVENTLYHHNGRLETTTQTIGRMFADIERFGLPQLNAQFRRLEANEIVAKGLDYIDQLAVDRTLLKQQVDGELEASGGFYSSLIENPEYLAIKRYLQSIPGQSREDRKLIPRAAYELLQLYWSSIEGQTN